MMNRFWSILMIMIGLLNAVWADEVVFFEEDQTVVQTTAVQDSSVRPGFSSVAVIQGAHEHSSEHSDCDHQPHPGCQHQCHLGHCQFVATAHLSLSIPEVTTALNPLSEFSVSSIDLSGPIRPPRA